MQRYSRHGNVSNTAGRLGVRRTHGETVASPPVVRGLRELSAGLWTFATYQPRRAVSAEDGVASMSHKFIAPYIFAPQHSSPLPPR